MPILNILTFQPTSAPQSKERSIHEICSAIQKGEQSKNDNTHITINKKAFDLSCNVPSNYTGTIFIYVSGYSGMSGNARYKYAGAGAYAVYTYLQQGLLQNGPCISFDGQVNYRKSFNFGQHHDQQCLHEVYQETIRCNPGAQIVLVGSCKGATTILNYLTNLNNNKINFRPIRAVILESPSISLEKLTQQVAENHVPRALQWLLPYCFKAFFPNYKWNQPTIIENASRFPAHIPVLIGCLPHDKVASYNGIREIAGKLERNCRLYVCDNVAIKHGHLAKVKEYKEVIDKFLHQHGILA